MQGEYNSDKAQHKTRVRRKRASFRGKKIVANQKLRQFIDGALSDSQSPEAIAGRLKYQIKDLPCVSKDTIYRYLKSPYGKMIGIKWRKKIRPKQSRKVSKLQGRIFLDNRPKVIDRRSRTGDAEADFVVSGKSGKGVLLVATDRRLRTSFLELIHQVTIDEVHTAFIRIKRRFPEMRTLTLDNDILFRMHKTLEQLLEVKIYFCHPYHSWEKGSVENVNKTIRKFIPKGSNLANYSSGYIKVIEQYLNQRFMKCLLYKTPNEKLKKHRQTKNSLKKL